MEQPQKHLTDHSSNQMIREAIRSIALKGVVNQQTGTVNGTSRVTGFVAKVHTDEADELYGTIDVQEYPNWSLGDSDNGAYGYHEGVLLTALQNNMQGYVIIPKLHSDVLLSKDPETGNEYVTMFSHVDVIQLDSHEQVSVGVRQREPYDPNDENAPDIHELQLTGVKSNTTYGVDSIVSSVMGKDGAGEIANKVGDDKTSSTMTEEGMNITHDKGTVDVNGDETTIAQGDSKVKVTDGVVYVGDDSGSNVDDAVLGVQLASILEEMLDALGQAKTTTQLGPQPFINLAQFLSLKAKISSFKSAHSGFLTTKVKIQKK